MYESFYHLHTNPFSLTPDPQFCFSHSGYRQAREYLEYALKLGEGLVMVTGRPGTGKTTLAETFLDTLNMGSVMAAHIAASSLDADDLLRTVAYAFDIKTEHNDRASLRHCIRQYFEKMARSGQRALLIIDEAQGLPCAALDELRLLADLQSGSRQLLQLFLIGQEQLRERMSDPEMEYFQQRVIANYHLVPLDLTESRDYVEYRLRQAGWRGDPELTGAAVLDIYRFSRGVPRHINKLCNRLLLLGYGIGRHTLDSDDVLAIAEEMDAEQLRPMSSAQPDTEDLSERLHAKEFQQGLLSDLAICATAQRHAEPPLWVVAAEETECPVAELSESNNESDSPAAFVAPEVAEPDILSPRKAHDERSQWLVGMSGWQEKLVPSLGFLTGAVLSITVIAGSYDNDGTQWPNVTDDASVVSNPLPVPASDQQATVSIAPAGRASAQPGLKMVPELTSTEAAAAEFIVTDNPFLQHVLNDELPVTAAETGFIGLESGGTASAEGKAVAVQRDGRDVRVVDSMDTDVEKLIAQGYRAMEDFRLLTPAQDSAYYYFQAALRLAPDNTDAMAGLGLIAERYVLLANKALRQKDKVKADRYIARGLSLQPDNSKLLTLKEGLNEPLISLVNDRDETPAKNDGWQNVSRFFSQFKTFLTRADQGHSEFLVANQATSSFLRE